MVTTFALVVSINRNFSHLRKCVVSLTIVTTIFKTSNKILNLIRNKNQKDSFTTRKHKTIPVAIRKKL